MKKARDKTELKGQSVDQPKLGLGRKPTFNPLRIENWPSLYKLSSLLLIWPVLHALSIVDALSLRLLFIQSTLIILASIKAKALLDKRRELMKIFDKGGVPSVPNKHWLSGNLFEVIVPHNNLEVIDSFHQKLGKTYGMFYGPDPWVFSTDLDLLHLVFVQQGSKNIDITQYRMPFMTELNNSLAQLQGDEWRKTRRTIDPSFAQRQMKSDNVYQDIDAACARVLGCISSHPISEDYSSRVVDVLYTFKKFSVEVIFRVAYGRDNIVNMEPHAREPLIDTIKSGADMIRGPIAWVSIMFESLQSFIGFFAQFTPIGRCIKNIHSVLDDSLEHRRQVGVNLEKRNRKMIDTIIESVDSNKMSDEIIKANLFFIFVAGFETTANTLALMFWHLSWDQDRQEKLRKSLVTDGSHSQYLEWCIQETLRLYPAVPTAIGRVIHEKLDYNGFTFYPGTTINASIYSLHRCKEYWGPEPNEFRPERFGELNLHPAQYFAFGIGPRYCIGMNLALAELHALIPQLLLKYRVEPCKSTPERLKITSPNLLHMIIDGKIEVKFVELSTM